MKEFFIIETVNNFVIHNIVTFHTNFMVRIALVFNLVDFYRTRPP